MVTFSHFQQGGCLMGAWLRLADFGRMLPHGLVAFPSNRVLSILT